MIEGIDIEGWALNQAQQIVLREGINLVQSAQGLDRKRTSKNSRELKEAIFASLVAARNLSFRGY